MAAGFALCLAGTSSIAAAAQNLCVGDAFCPEPQLSDFTPLVNCEEPGITVDAASDPFCGKEINLSVPSPVVPREVSGLWAKPTIIFGVNTSKPRAPSRFSSSRSKDVWYRFDPVRNEMVGEWGAIASVDDLLWRGKLQLDRHQYSKAQISFRRAANNETDASEHEYCLGFLALAKRNIFSSEKHFDTWSSMKRVPPCALRDLARKFEQLGYLEQSVHFLKKALAVEDEQSLKDSMKIDISMMEKNLAGCEGCANDDRDYFGRLSIDRLTRWKANRLPIKVFVSIDPKMVATFDFRKVFVSALEKWMHALDGRLSYTFVDGPDEANISVHLDSSTIQDRVRGITEFDASESDWSASTDYLRKGYITVYLRTTSGGTHSERMISYVCLHELGHALGITGHSANSDDIMYYVNRTFDPRVTLSERDRSTIRKLYWDYSPKPAPVAQRAKLKLFRDRHVDLKGT